MELPVYSFLYLLDIFTIQNSSDMRGKEDSRPAVLKSVLRMDDSPRFSRNPLSCLFQ